jgi:phosphatidylglycerophosphate synthase
MRVVLWSVTLLRVALIPLFLFLGSAAQEAARAGADFAPLRWSAIGVLVLMGCTDVLDGWIARRWKLASQVGAVVDAVADKLVQVCLVAFFTLVVGPAFRTLPFWFLILIFGRDLVLLIGVLMLRWRYGPLQVVHRIHGRAASVLVHVVLYWAAFRLPSAGMTLLMVVTAALSIFSATVYALDGAAQGEAAAEARGG